MAKRNRKQSKEQATEQAVVVIEEQATSSPVEEPAKEETTMKTQEQEQATEQAKQEPKSSPKRGNVVPARYRPNFHAIAGLRTPSGTLVVATADDAVTRLLAGLDSVALEQEAARLGIEWRWAHLNPGMQRMNLGNRLRSAIRRGELAVESLG